MIDLESEVERLKGLASAWERSATLAEGERDQLKADLAMMTAKMEHYQIIVTRADAQFEMLGKCVIDAMKTLRGQSGYEPKAGAQREIALALEHAARDINDEGAGDVPSIISRPHE